MLNPLIVLGVIAGIVGIVGLVVVMGRMNEDGLPDPRPDERDSLRQFREIVGRQDRV